MGFRVGQEVVCVDASPARAWLACGIVMLVKNQKYTVSDVNMDAEEWGPEAVGDIKVDGIDFWFSRSRFRPLTSRPTDISIFTAMLGSKAKEEV